MASPAQKPLVFDSAACADLTNRLVYNCVRSSLENVHAAQVPLTQEVMKDLMIEINSEVYTVLHRHLVDRVHLFLPIPPPYWEMPKLDETIKSFAPERVPSGASRSDALFLAPPSSQ